MDHDTRITLVVIAGLIILLSILAIFLRSGTEAPGERTDNYSAQATSTPGGTAGQPQSINTSNQPPMSTSSISLPETITSAVMTTNKGIVEITFNNATPITVQNFAKLAASGFYNGTRFHRVINDFMIQGGDPLSKDVSMKDRWGTGGPGYSFQDEVSPQDQFTQGMLAMANSGPNTNGSQFFIVTAKAGTPWLAGKHTIFGKVTKGMDVVFAIEDMQTDGADRPLQDVIIESITIR